MTRSESTSAAAPVPASGVPAPPLPPPLAGDQSAGGSAVGGRPDGGPGTLGAGDARGLTDVVTRLRRVLRASIRADYPWESLP
ncbi:MAG TPA: hypothetical protein VH372_25020, partial [Actinospica sp.]|nr:hypothetical protein [Actinospica sp.]